MSRKTPTESVRTIDLDHEQLLVLDNRVGARIRVLSGGTWLTEEGRLDDVHVWQGDAITLTTPGRALLEGVGTARIEVMLPRRAGWLARVAQAVRAWRRDGVAPALRGAAVAFSIVVGLGLADGVARGFLHAGAAPPAYAMQDVPTAMPAPPTQSL